MYVQWWTLKSKQKSPNAHLLSLGTKGLMHKAKKKYGTEKSLNILSRSLCKILQSVKASGVVTNVNEV